MLASISLQPSSHENVDAVLLRLKVRPQEKPNLPSEVGASLSAVPLGSLLRSLFDQSGEHFSSQGLREKE